MSLYSLSHREVDEIIKKGNESLAFIKVFLDNYKKYMETNGLSELMTLTLLKYNNSAYRELYPNIRAKWNSVSKYISKVRPDYIPLIPPRHMTPKIEARRYLYTFLRPIKTPRGSPNIDFIKMKVIELVKSLEEDSIEYPPSTAIGCHTVEDIIRFNFPFVKEFYDYEDSMFPELMAAEGDISRLNVLRDKYPDLILIERT